MCGNCNDDDKMPLGLKILFAGAFVLLCFVIGKVLTGEI